MTGAERTTAVLEFAHSRRQRRTQRVRREQAGKPDTDPAQRSAVLAFLNEALAGKLAAVLRYRRHHFIARGLASRRICEELLVHSDEELSHADLIAERIVQLGAVPDFSPTLAQPSPGQCAPSASIADLITQNLLAARTELETCRDRIERLAAGDPATRRMLEGILAVKEAHANELAELLQGAIKIG